MKKLRIHSCLCLCILVTGCESDDQSRGVIQIEAPADRPVLNADPPPRSTGMNGSDLPMIQTDPQGNLSDEAPSDPFCETGQQRVCDPMCGQQSCTDGNWGECLSTLERCNTHDDDCDGQIDEGLGLGMNCTDRLDNGCTGVGTLGCDLSTGSVECQVSNATPVPERCDGLDNDCDGTPDEDFPNQRCCTVDYHCPPRAECVANECVGGATNGGNNGSAGGSNDTGVGALCISSFDCMLGLTCADGTCQGVCFFDGDCPAGQLCACPANDPDCILTICREVAPQDGQVNCQAPRPINALGRYMADTNGAANDLNSSCGNGGTGPDLVFQLMLPEAQLITIDTSGSSFDTVMTARTQCADANSEIACDDDGGDGTTSRMTMEVQAGQSYFITIHGYGLNSAGVVMLQVASAQNAPGNPNGGGLCQNICAFANDGACDDGGPDSAFSICEFGTDCADCGPR